MSTRWRECSSSENTEAQSHDQTRCIDIPGLTLTPAPPTPQTPAVPAAVGPPTIYTDQDRPSTSPNLREGDTICIEHDRQTTEEVEVATLHCVCKFPKACEERRAVQFSESTPIQHPLASVRGQSFQHSSSSTGSQSSGGVELGFFEAMSLNNPRSPSHGEGSSEFRPLNPVAEQLASGLVSKLHLVQKDFMFASSDIELTD